MTRCSRPWPCPPPVLFGFGVLSIAVRGGLKFATLELRDFNHAARSAIHSWFQCLAQQCPKQATAGITSGDESCPLVGRRVSLAHRPCNHAVLFSERRERNRISPRHRHIQISREPKGLYAGRSSVFLPRELADLMRFTTSMLIDGNICTILPAC